MSGRQMIRNRSLFVKLLLFMTAVVIVTVLLISSVTYTISANTSTQNAIEYNQSVLQQQRDLIHKELYAIKNIAASMTMTQTYLYHTIDNRLSVGSLIDLTRHLEEQQKLSPYLESIYLVYKKLDLVITSRPDIKMSPLSTFADRSWLPEFDREAGSRTVWLTGRANGLTQGARATSFMQKMPLIGQLDGAIVVNVKLDLLFTDFLSHYHHKKGTTLVLGPNDELLYSESGAASSLVSGLDTGAFSAAGSGSYIDDHRQIVTYTTSELTGWKFVNITSQAAMLQGLSRIKTIVIAVSVFYAALAIGLSFYISRRLYRPLKAVMAYIGGSNAASAVSAGDSPGHTEPLAAADEASFIRQSFERLSHSRETILSEKRRVETLLSDNRSAIKEKYLSNLLKGGALSSREHEAKHTEASSIGDGLPSGDAGRLAAASSQPDAPDSGMLDDMAGPDGGLSRRGQERRTTEAAEAAPKTSGRESSTAGLRDDAAELLGLKLDFARFAVLTLELEEPKLLGATDDKLHFHLFQYGLMEELGAELDGEIFVRDDERMVILATVPVGADNVPYELAGKLQRDLGERYGLTATIGISRIYSGIPSVRNAYEESIEALNLKMYVGQGEIVPYAIVSSWKQDEQAYYYPYELETKLLQALLQLNEEECETIVRQITREVATRKLGKANVQQLFFQLGGEIVKTLMQTGGDPSAVFGDQPFPLSRAQTLRDMEHCVLEMCAQIVEHNREKRLKLNDVTLQLATEFMDRNYNNNITINTVAEHVQRSTSFLSRIFKEATGTTINDYLIHLRIKRACELLLQPKYSLEDICREIGYSNVSYFSKLFKSRMGHTPGQFRQLQAAELLLRDE
ncbi:helix-turn-helix domain-containing protein [Paenibacillus hodogayensis]|uniref:Helix-turn-helix domain-containing protein n=1 Tax=Paenibacillus hodogayensis TaxID=279208 RepID=A0ABV5VV02_9BACL